jgi:hypothetical protein
MDLHKIDFEAEDFIIRVRPSLDRDEWTGEIDISIVSSGDNPMDDESYGQLMHFCKMMCATVPIMETDEKLRDTVHEYVLNVVDAEEFPIEEDKRLVITGEDGNIVHLDFGSKTKGNA